MTEQQRKKWVEYYAESVRAANIAGIFIQPAIVPTDKPVELQEELARLRAEKLDKHLKSMMITQEQIDELLSEVDKVAEDEVEQARRQAGSKPPQYQIGIDTFERSKANQMAETRVEIAKFMIDKYNWRNKGQDKEDFQKIKDYCDFAIEALDERKG